MSCVENRPVIALESSTTTEPNLDGSDWTPLGKALEYYIYVRTQCTRAVALRQEISQGPLGVCNSRQDPKSKNPRHLNKTNTLVWWKLGSCHRYTALTNVVFPIVRWGNKSGTHTVCPRHFEPVSEPWAWSEREGTKSKGLCAEFIHYVANTADKQYYYQRIWKDWRWIFTLAMSKYRREHNWGSWWAHFRHLIALCWQVGGEKLLLDSYKIKGN